MQLNSRTVVRTQQRPWKAPTNCHPQHGFLPVALTCEWSPASGAWPHRRSLCKAHGSYAASCASRSLLPSTPCRQGNHAPCFHKRMQCVFSSLKAVTRPSTLQTRSFTSRPASREHQHRLGRRSSFWPNSLIGVTCNTRLYTSAKRDSVFHCGSSSWTGAASLPSLQMGVGSVSSLQVGPRVQFGLNSRTGAGWQRQTRNSLWHRVQCKGADPDWVYTESMGWVKIAPPPPKPPPEDDKLASFMGGAWRMCLGASNVVVEKLTDFMAAMTPPSVSRSTVEVCVKGALILGLLLLVRAMLSVLLTVGAVLLVSYMTSVMLKSAQPQARPEQPGRGPPPPTRPMSNNAAQFGRGRQPAQQQGDLVDVWRDRPRI